MVAAIRYEKFRMSGYSRGMIFGPLAGLAVIGIGNYFLGPNAYVLVVGLIVTFAVGIWAVRSAQK
ncbi:MAG TPA: hypothetical protein VIJ29_03115 [Candidatus Paceibacterota bacterium]